MRLVRLLPRDHSGPTVARLYHRLLALLFLVAWLSLGSQVQLLIGSHGLMPISAYLVRARDRLGFADFPTLFWLGVGDDTLTAGIVVGVALALMALFDRRGRLQGALFAAQVVLYLSFATAARTFMAFQWDNLLLECGTFAALLPRTRRSPWLHTLFRLILLKLYWESGIAKWQSHLHDWQDGSAMTHYYETAPLPTALAWYLHHAPVWWHHFESWATLAFELAVPLGIFVGARRVRLGCALILTGFQVINAATANYGFFCYLAVALHLFLFDEADVERLGRRLGGWLGRWLPSVAKGECVSAAAPPAVASSRRAPALVGALALTLFVGLSLIDGLMAFVSSPPLLARLMPIRRVYAPFRLVNTYHLFAHITRRRVEADFQTSDDGVTWSSHDFWHKPGDPWRRPDLVAPHQPRVDFQLWFYGLNYRLGTPEYVAHLIERLCREPERVAPLLRRPPTRRPQAARIVFWDYRFTTAAERHASGAWWARTQVDVTEAVPCETRFPPPEELDEE